ncbi:outer membrane scaffolding protein for murein synthesis (MipA/OmpV family) [Inhella inkyongensis]|uniref:Outer membrane scaffolding protein for murein synthesis (MipA/OmpV family) n=1 Tax=Inhella inkyongensis TaxID=392593 RepID=A0A840S6E2_9BURK|nr:MipA/OmpV family protein [Inhella inkyongensis]MBB5205162.1 outer membrane scaffolding protein for murein synthesis (MipA/OmpV family) [Inhella inkyongensis]
MLSLTLALAAAAPTSTPPAQSLWEAGALGLVVNQQAYPGADQQISRGLALPYLLYRGRYLRADGETAGLRAVHTPRVEFDIGFSGSFGSGGRDIDARRGLAHLGTLVELGPRLKWNLDAGTEPGSGRWRALFPLRAVFDLSERAQHRGWAFEPELLYSRTSAQGWRYSLGLGAIATDQRLAQHFYGVRPEQALADRPTYAARAGLVAWRLTSGFNKSLNRDWRLFGFARLQSVAGAVNEDSPLVRQRTGLSAGIGLSYTFARSSESGVD